MLEDSFKYTDETFDDIQMLRYNLKGFEDLTLKQKNIFIVYPRQHFTVEISHLINLENII